jgi:hypothetical protein
VQRERTADDVYQRDLQLSHQQLIIIKVEVCMYQKMMLKEDDKWPIGKHHQPHWSTFYDPFGPKNGV